MRGHEEELSLEKNGSIVMELDAKMNVDEFGDREAIRQKYLPQVAEKLKERLGASRVQIHDYLVQKSSPCSKLSPLS